jgi:hypothetical protein
MHVYVYMGTCVSNELQFNQSYKPNGKINGVFFYVEKNSLFLPLKYMQQTVFTL